MRITTAVLLIFIFTFSEAQNKDKLNILQAVDININNSSSLKNKLDSVEAFKNSFYGISIFDTNENKYVVDINAQKYFTPASNAKIFTLNTGLTNIGHKIPVLFYIKAKDSLIIFGTGSPTLLNNQFIDSSALEFLNSRDEDIYFSDSNFLNNKLGQGWAWDDYSDPYSKEQSAFNIYGNSIKISQLSNDSLSVYPIQFSDSIIIKGYSDKLKVKRNLDSNTFYVWLGKTNNNENITNSQKEIPLKTSTNLSLKLLSDTLKKQIKITNRKIYDTDVLQTLYGINTDTLYKAMMQESDNFIAESVLTMSASSLMLQDSLQTNLLINRVVNEQLGFITNKPKWVDGSGLSRYNLFTPLSFVEVLKNIRTNQLAENNSMNKIYSILSTGGKNGTLKDRFVNMPEFIYAKTGTLSNNHNVSGYLKTKSGKLLIFSFMNNHYTCSITTIQTQMDEILKAYYLYYK